MASRLIAPMMGRGVLAGPRGPFGGVNPLTGFNFLTNNANNGQDQEAARVATSDFDDSDDDIPAAALPPNQRGR